VAQAGIIHKWSRSMCLQGTHLRGFQDQVDARVGKGAVKLAWGWG